MNIKLEKTFPIVKDIYGTPGTDLEDLPVEVLGVFDIATGLTVDLDKELPARYELKMKTNDDRKVLVGAGHNIEKGTVSKEIHNYQAPVEQQLIVTLTNALVDTNYTFKVEVNNETYEKLRGRAKTYSFSCYSPDLVGNVNTRAANPAQIMTDIYREMIDNSEFSLFVKADLVANAVITNVAGVTAAKGDVISLADAEKLIAYNDSVSSNSQVVKLDIQLTTIQLKKNLNNKNYSEAYVANRNTFLTVSFFNERNIKCSDVTVKTEGVIELNSGYDIKYQEFMSSLGLNYRYLSGQWGYGESDEIEFITDSTKNYDTTSLVYSNTYSENNGKVISERATTSLAVAKGITSPNLTKFLAKV